MTHFKLFNDYIMRAKKFNKDSDVKIAYISLFIFVFYIIIQSFAVCSIYHLLNKPPSRSTQNQESVPMETNKL